MAVTAQEAMTVSLTCSSAAGEREHCAANTSAGVLMARSVGSSACLLGKTWGYDDGGVWVLDGCSAEFIVAGVPGATPALAGAEEAAAMSEPASPVVAQATQAPTETAAPAEKTQPEPANETWGHLDPGKGLLLGKGEAGEISLSAYALVQYLNQLDDDSMFTDHLERVRPIDGRQDIYSHRVLVWLNGWMGVPKLRYTIAWWTVTETDQDALFGNIGYQFNEHFNLYAGIFGNPGSRSMQGSHRTRNRPASTRSANNPPSGVHEGAGPSMEA